MSIKKIWGTRTKVNVETYVGEKGSLFYDEATGVLRLSDGHTPGGVPVTINAVSIVTDNLLPGTDNIYGIGQPDLRWNHLHIGDGGIYFDGNQTSSSQTLPYIPGALVSNIIPASDNGVSLGNADHRFANAYLGTSGLFLADSVTDANINIVATNGTLYLNGAQNLRVGNLVIVDTTLTSATSNLDISIGATDDTGFFYIKRKAQFDNTTYGDTEAMVSINASGGADPLTNFPDTLIQITGRPNKTSRIIQRAYGSDPQVPANNSYAVWGSYAARGTVASPQPLQAGDILARISANGYGKTGGTGLWGSGGTRIESVALENFTATAKGSKINFYTTPIGQTTSQNVASITSTGMSAKAMEFQSDIDLANGKKQSKAGIEWDQKGVVNGVASLDNNGKLDASQIPDALTGAIVFKGTWNANTNTPTLSNTLPAGLDIGWEYIVDVPGTRDIGDGSKSFLSGDFVIFDGTHWKQVPSGNAFVSLSNGGHITVNQSTGAMTLGSDATSSSTNGTIVARDASGNFSANIITAALNGNANTASSATSAGKSTNLAGGVLGSMPYQSAADTTLFVAPNTTSTKKFFTQTGTGTVGVAPTWDTLSKSDVGLNNVDNTADANKNVLYAASAGGAPATDVYAWAKAATKPTYTKSDVGLSAVENTALSTWSGSSSITTVGTLGSLSVTATITGSVSGNAGTVTNGVYTNGSYSDPSWLTISKSKVGLSAVENTALSTWAGSSNITTVGTLTSGSIGSGFTAIANARLANSTIQVNGVTLALGDTGKTITADASTLTGTTLNSTVVTSSLTALGGMSTIKAGSLSVDPPAMAGKNVSVVGTYTITGLTTNHKVIIMPQSALPDNYNIGGAWASATNTLSINFQSYAASVDAAAFTIAYFAWV